MPFKSKAQRRWMYENQPEMAAQWEKETPPDAQLPERSKTEQAKRSHAKRHSGAKTVKSSVRPRSLINHVKLRKDSSPT